MLIGIIATECGFPRPLNFSAFVTSAWCQSTAEATRITRQRCDVFIKRCPAASADIDPDDSGINLSALPRK